MSRVDQERKAMDDLRNKIPVAEIRRKYKYSLPVIQAMQDTIWRESKNQSDTFDPDMEGPEF
ncbi:MULTISPECIES: hypothetical protein [Bifidobacterium]|uniref:Uncharacterized protein n=1 Tax=Bifidobacterium asteroides TaxID=1684 RepID=A0A556R9X2_9BIFI|nr:MULTISPECIES: hypothetical protein [Bifidobacterium]MBI0086607.1 hypothetical protein [Bifidobacterium sp. M0404]TSJ85690.1 hypothetical protein FPK29_04840 [Bifidobacterium polysaccharolyticum]